MHQRPLVAIVLLSVVVAGCSGETRPTTESKAPAAAAAATLTTDMEAAIAHHVKTVKAADVDGVMADYATDAILVSPPGLVTPTGTFVGKDKVREFFVWLATPAVLPAAGCGGAAAARRQCAPPPPRRLCFGTAPVR